MFNFHGWIATHIFPFLKLTSWSALVFTLFLGELGVISLHFLSTPWICCAFIFSNQDYLNWLTTDILQLFSVIQILTAGNGKGHYIFKVVTPAFSVYGAGLARTGYGRLKDDILSKPSPVVSMGEYRQRSGQLSPCHLCCKVSGMPYKLPSPSPFHPTTSCSSLSLSPIGSLMHAHAHKHCLQRDTYSVNRDDYSWEAIWRNYHSKGVKLTKYLCASNWADNKIIFCAEEASWFRKTIVKNSKCLRVKWW